jgi:hypothetical protein
MLIGGLVPAVTCGGILVAGAVILSTPAGIGVGLGVALAVLALAVAPGLLRGTRSWIPALAMVAALVAYAGVMSLLWWVYALVSRLSWLEPRATGVGVGVATVAWSLGVLRAMPRLRQHLYDDGGSPVP